MLANAQKGLVFKHISKPEIDLLDQNGVEYLVSNKEHSTILLSLQPHPLSSDDLLMELIVKGNGSNFSLPIDPKRISIEVTYDKNKNNNLTCFDPIMLARLYAGEKAIATKQDYLQQVLQNSGQSGLDSAKSIIRTNAADKAKPEHFGLLASTLLTELDTKTAGLVNFPMPNKKCEHLTVRIPIANEIHELHYAVATGKLLTKPNSPLINYYFQKQVNGIHTQLLSPIEIIFGNEYEKIALSTIECL